MVDHELPVSRFVEAASGSNGQPSIPSCRIAVRHVRAASAVARDQ